MTMQDMISMLTQSGVTIVVIAYFMFRDFKFMSQLQETLTTLVNTVNTLQEIVKAKGVE